MLSPISLYITTENQEILWNEIHKIAYIQTLPPEFKYSWFKELIQNIHLRHPSILTYEDCLALNKETLDNVVEFIRAQTTGWPLAQTTTQPIGWPSTQPMPTRDQTGLVNSNDAMYNRLMEERQREYAPLISQPQPVETVQLPPTITTTEEEQDTPISDVNTTLKQIAMAREQGLSRFRRR